MVNYRVWSHKEFLFKQKIIMRIILLIDSLGSGGAQRQMVALAKGFKKRGYEIIVLTYHNINFFKPELDEANIEVICLEQPNPVLRILKIRKKIRALSPDAVLSFLVTPNFLATLSGFPWRRWRLVVGERNAKPSIVTSSKNWFFRFFHIFTDMVVGNSVENILMVKKVNPILSSRKTSVIYNIVNVPQLKVKQSISTEKLKIVIAARYESQKNLDGLIETLISFPKNILEKIQINWYGSMSGRDDYLNHLKTKIKLNNLQSTLILNDATADIFERYVEADFVGLFSHFEGFPNTICEAMALGKPVIVTKVSDVPNFVKEDVNGFLCYSHEPSSMKAALLKALNSTSKERLEMGLNNKKLANQFFNEDKIIEQYLDVLMN